MTASGTTITPGRSRARRLVPAAVVVTMLSVGGAWLVSAVQKARNAAHSANTT